MAVHSYSLKASYSLLCGIIIFGCLPFEASAQADPAMNAGLVPHKALYEVRLSSKKSSAKVSNITGKMFYEWQPECEAWVSNHRFDMMYEYVELPPVRITSEFSTYESFDGKSFNFTSQRKREGVLLEEVRGSVQPNDAGTGQQAVYNVPADLVYDLPDGTLFPMAHTLDVLQKIKDGKTFYKATIFDGSDEDGPVDINSFVGKQGAFTAEKQYEAMIDKDLVANTAQKMRLAFFPLNNADLTSDYEMSLLFHDNGVISNMTIDYSDFSIEQTLIAIEPLGSKCGVEGKEDEKQKDNKK